MATRITTALVSCETVALMHAAWLRNKRFDDLNRRIGNVDKLPERIEANTITNVSRAWKSAPRLFGDARLTPGTRVRALPEAMANEAKHLSVKIRTGASRFLEMQLRRPNWYGEAPYSYGTDRSGMSSSPATHNWRKRHRRCKRRASRPARSWCGRGTWPSRRRT